MYGLFKNYHVSNNDDYVGVSFAMYFMFHLFLVCVCLFWRAGLKIIESIISFLLLSLSLSLSTHTRIWNSEKYIMIKFKWNRHNITSQNLISEYLSDIATRSFHNRFYPNLTKSFILQCYQLCWCHFYIHCLIWGSS